MTLRHNKTALMATAMGALLIFPGAARADDTTEEIRLLKAQLKKLEEKVNEQARKQKETQVQIRNVAAQPAPPAPPPGSPYGGPPIGVGLGPLGGAPQQGLTATESSIRGLPVAGSPSLYINGVSITPGGFLALESVFRTRFIGADIGTPYQNIPFYNTRSGYANEFRFSAARAAFRCLCKATRRRRRIWPAMPSSTSSAPLKPRIQTKATRTILAFGTSTRPSMTIIGARIFSPVRTGPC